MTTISIDGSTDTHVAMLLREDDDDGPAGDRVLLAELRAAPDVVIVDHEADMRSELAALRPAVDDAVRGEPHRWAWYPWRRSLVSVPGPLSFRRIRLDRNRNKITSAEQDGYRRLTIGIVGLSVGHSIGHTLALEGLCGRLRLADSDCIELSNLNRIPATVFDIGINKAVVVARRIAELDPYLPVEVFTSGVTEQNLDEFFAGLDVVIEECDSLDMKVRVRQGARARGIPVLMDTSDRGLFDVERFDVEPDRALFHGLLGDIDPASLQGLSTRDKAPHVMRILQAAELSPRMAASLVEIDRTVSTWPQLAGDVQLGAATVAAAIRRFGRGEPLPSGRLRIDLDNALKTLCDPTEQPAGVVPPPVGVDLTARVPVGPVDAVLQAMALAPSGGNSQPWALSVVPGGVQIDLVPARTSAMDVAFRGSYVGIGAAAFNAQVAAARHGLRAWITAFPDERDPNLAVSITLAAGSDPELAGLYPAMVQRITNRNQGRRRALRTDLVNDLHRAAAAAGAAVHLITDRAQLADVAEILAASDRIRFLTPPLHQQMMAELNWDDHAALGIDVTSLGLDDADMAKLAVSSRADVMEYLATWDGGTALGDSTRDRVNTSSAVAVVTVPGATPADYMRGGMAAEQVWIRAGQHQLGVQPVSPVFLYATSNTDLQALSAEYGADLRDLQSRFQAAIGIDSSQSPVLVLRLSHDAPAAVRGRRLERQCGDVTDRCVVKGLGAVMVKLKLEDLVTSVATELMGVTVSTLQTASTQLLHQLVTYFQVDLSFLRRNDHVLGATVLVAEWPPRPDIPVPDPLGVIYFAGADPTFAALENLTSVLTTRPTVDQEYQDRIRQGSGVQGVSLATVPLLTSEHTTGTLGFIKFGDREWHHDEINALQAVAALLAQLQARVAAEERLRYLAYHDELTTLATRRGLTDHLTQRLRSGAAGPVAVIFIDVDRLKALNSFLGHAAGDHFLQTLAHRLTQASPEEHLLARLGGDEFVAVMTGPADQERASAYAELLRHAANQPVRVGDEEITRAVSLGVALGEPGISTVSELMNQADQAMLQAKSRGGNGVCVFTAEMRRNNEIRTDIELHLVTAIRTGALVLHYQPEIALLTGNITGVEALVRWPHPNLGMLPPSSFIDLIETTNLAGELGRWVIETGCRQLKTWHDQFPDRPPIGLSVNVSPAELITTDFVDTVRHTLQDTGLSGHHLTLEITEKALVRDTEQALATLHGLRTLGVQIAIDDFGTGYSSFAQLKSLPVDILKIDRGFVRDLGHNTNDLAIVRSIISLADAFGLRTVAEGVETDVAAATLIALGCVRAQGFLYAKPCPAQELDTILHMKQLPM